MGGTGGGFLGKETAQTFARSIRKMELSAQSEEFELSVAALLAEALADANNRDTDAVEVHLGEIRSALGKDIEGSIDLFFGGSIAKKTYVDGLSDVDTLVEINNSELTSLPPNEVCNYIQNKLGERFSNTEITRDGFAISVIFKDITVQLVPVIRKGDDYLLPDGACQNWSHVRPKNFTDELTRVNKECANKVIPVIKLSKGLISILPEARRITGYHTELLAAQIFQQYKGPLTLKAMVHHFFASAPGLIREPVSDPTGQSRFVDDHLGQAHSLERLMVADSIDRIGRRLRNADGAQSIDQWQELLRGGE